MRGTPHILVVDDDPAIRRTLAAELKAEGYAVSEAADGREALASFAREEPDLVLTDLAMPVSDGFDVVSGVRKAGPTPILVLSVRGADGDKIRALDLGADDYVTKPFSMKELLARIAAHLRRGGGAAAGGEDVFDDGRLRVDRARHAVERDGKSVHLTKKELDLLWLLIRSGGRVVSRETILSRLWDYAADVETRTVDVHVRSIRKKLGDDVVETVVGVGYRFPA